jgi:hypothetical protein
MLGPPTHRELGEGLRHQLQLADVAAYPQALRVGRAELQAEDHPPARRQRRALQVKYTTNGSGAVTSVHRVLRIHALQCRLHERGSWKHHPRLTPCHHAPSLIFLSRTGQTLAASEPQTVEHQC